MQNGVFRSDLAVLPDLTLTKLLSAPHFLTHDMTSTIDPSNLMQSLPWREVLTLVSVDLNLSAENSVLPVQISDKL